MLIQSVEAENFRNITGKIECADGLNILYGDNGFGKTSWLEAINLLANAKSFRTSRLQETITFNEKTAIVRAEIQRSAGLSRHLQVILNGATKTLTVNKKKAPAREFLEQLYISNFNSDALEIVRGSPEARRRFLDEGILAIYPAYVQTLADYNRVIKQKNSLLHAAKDNSDSLEKTASLLEPWNEQLADLAQRIDTARRRFVDRLNKVLEKRLFEREEVAISYLSSVEGKGDLSDYKALLLERLALRLNAEVFAGYALIGTHRDDLKISFDGIDLRKFGSSGQQRSALIIVLLAQLSVFNEQQKEYPIFLLDDLDSELDDNRIGKLLEFLREKTQVFVTTSKEGFISKFGTGAKIHDIPPPQPAV